MYALKRKEIIGAAEVTTIRQNNNPQQNSRFLYDHLSKCDDKSFMEVCDEIIAVKGNPRMKNLGTDMKAMMESELYVQV